MKNMIIEVRNLIDGLSRLQHQRYLVNWKVCQKKTFFLKLNETNGWKYKKEDEGHGKK